MKQFVMEVRTSSDSFLKRHGETGRLEYPRPFFRADLRDVLSNGRSLANRQTVRAVTPALPFCTNENVLNRELPTTEQVRRAANVVVNLMTFPPRTRGQLYGEEADH